MLLAVSMGWAQPRRLALSRRRWIRRLWLARRRRMMAFTRNPSALGVSENVATLQTPQECRGISLFFSRRPGRPPAPSLVQGLGRSLLDLSLNARTDRLAARSNNGRRPP